MIYGYTGIEGLDLPWQNQDARSPHFLGFAAYAAEFVEPLTEGTDFFFFNYQPIIKA